MMAASYFAQSYRQAREKFLASAQTHGLEISAFENPAGPGPDGEVLAADVAATTNHDAQNLLLLVSGTHGAEGYCGSGCQIAFLEEDRGEGNKGATQVLLVHAINPYGFAWLRRVNEDNVDLNRNSIDHVQHPPTSRNFENLHPHLIPKDWHGPSRERAEAAIAQFIEKNGVRAFQAEVTGGQYTHPDGLFYGGNALTWSTRTFREIVKRWGRNKRQVAIIDFHTGLGPKGYGEPIYPGNDPQELARARAWFGDQVTAIYQGDSASAVVSGPLINGAHSLLPEAEVTCLALEYGTLPVAEVLTALRAEHWLHEYGDVSSPLGKEIKRQFRDSLYVDTDEWKSEVVERAREMVAKALAGLAS